MFENITCGVLIKRYKRFLADVRLPDGTPDGMIVTAHCANSGSMKSLLVENAPVYLSPNTNPKAKLNWRWEIVDVGSSLVGVNTSRPNHIVTAGIRSGTITELQGYARLKQEVKYGKNSRIDILLNDDTKPDCYVEVKNATMCRNTGIVEFPDGITARGAKHLQELSDMVAQGKRAVMVYLVNRTDCHILRIADDIDPHYKVCCQNAQQQGVEFLAYKVQFNTNTKGNIINITVDAPIMVDI